jgi:NAD(P) transhydrogenase
MRHYDLCVIGSGPGGQKAAIQAAKLGRKVCVIEKMQFVGGVAINTGTIPSKALKEAVVDLKATQRSLENLGTGAPTIDRRTQLSTLTSSCQRVIRAEIDVVRKHFASNGIDVIQGVGSFATPDTVVVETSTGIETIGAEFMCIGVGTTPAKPANVPFDDHRIITSDEILKLQHLPQTMIVVGGGVIGTEYASMLAALGVRVTLIEGRPRLMDFLDQEICEALQYHLRQSGATLRLGEKVVSIRMVEPPAGARASSSGELVEATLESGKAIRAECLMYCIGRQGATDRLNLTNAGLAADDRGRVKVNASYQTEVKNIYAVGDVIGFPALASTSMEQGRMAACHMFGEHVDSVPELFPYGIYAIPEISMVGWTEERLTQAGIPYEAGIALYKETGRGQLLGDEIGMLKMLIHQESGVVLGVHILGSQATELVHIGQAVMAFKGTVDYFVNTVFNYPTLAECYKVAAFNGRNKLRSV